MKIYSYRKSGIQLAGFTIIIGILLFAGLGSMVFGSGKSENKAIDAPMEPVSKKKFVMMDGFETAVFAGGCFWGVEGVFEMLKGVENVVSGYSGGDADTAHYNIVGSGTTGHAESVSIVYDPSTISYETLLEVFFSVAHDPTQLNFQGPDVGTQYRSAVFYADEQQKKITEKFIKDLESKGKYKESIVTQLVPLDAFYPAEDYHQDFLRLNPTYPYIVYWDMPKIKNLEKMYPELLAEN